MKYFIYFFLIILLNFFHSCKSKYILPLENKKESFDNDNEIFKKEKKIEYDVFIKEGKKFKNSNKVSKIQIKVIGGLMPFIKYDSTYNQTVIQYIYLDKNRNIISTEKTGLIENKFNIWIHPPRWDDYLILNTNSYPFFVHDSKVRNWSWNLKNTFENTKLVNLIHYKKHKYNGGTKITSQTKNKNGKSKAEYFFDKNNMLIIMKFKNFDKSEITLKLVNE